MKKLMLLSLLGLLMVSCNTIKNRSTEESISSFIEESFIAETSSELSFESSSSSIEDSSSSEISSSSSESSSSSSESSESSSSEPDLPPDNTINISYYDNDTLIYNQYVDENTVFTPSYIPEKENNIFYAWSASPNRLEYFDWTQTLENDLSVYAFWKLDGSDEGYYLPNSFVTDFQEVSDQVVFHSLKSLGYRNVLVIPIQFKGDVTYSEADLEKLEKGFFGEDSDTSWESLKSYYYKSSYGQLDINGTIGEVYTTTQTKAVVKNASDSTLRSIHNLALSAQNFSNEELQSYDLDHDGNLDAVYFMYRTKYSSGSGNFWAWTYWDGNTPNTTKPTIDNHVWMSFEFFNEGYGNAGLDAHTVIHESGHVLGLDDYYSELTYQPAGSLDMQDYNVLDQTVFSKMALNWTFPYVVDTDKEEVNITIRPFESSGDCIIIKNDWNGSATDEYLAIEFYTPTGLNYKDSQSAYPGNNIRGFTIPGIKIYHIDARVAQLNSSESFVKYVDELETGKKHAIASSNSPSWSFHGSTSDRNNFKLVHLLEATGTNSFKNGSIAKNTTLFTQGKGFTPSDTTTFFTKRLNFNDNTPIGYSIFVNLINSEEASLTITKI
ncbi:MAG: hypothetical protein LBM99_04325 [Bacillales bacterium]|jgi:M6 family metalloprotease-like protein|nr:hypothetical protein [Bacillales bacterium]